MQTAMITLITLVAFAANSVLCRWALMDQTIDPLSFSIVRIVSGALTLLILLCLSFNARLKSASVKSKVKVDIAVDNVSVRSKIQAQFDLTAIVALLVYMFGFSFAYVKLGAGLGALVLFVAVQFTMIAAHLISGNRMSLIEWCGCLLSVTGLVYLLMPSQSIAAPDFLSVMLMVLAGIGWGIYTLAGKKSLNALQSTAANFGFCSLAILALLTLLILLPNAMPLLKITKQGMIYAVISGAVASGMGYSLWYYVVKKLDTVLASIAQLSVPVIATLGGVILLSEPVTKQFVISSTVILLGIGLVIVAPKLNTKRS
ncbi:DMT family transporter [uncultured Vibrio sp.]|uniref:DMT family transporter n=1 Tax=uncultured Vibrio sp. TaxID=114054 RepID=UPI0026189C66|nr:DMT family transporter [uncultured Vibrio sp.]